MKNFILLTLAGIIVFTVSIVVLYQWDRNHSREYYEVKQNIETVDRRITDVETSLDGLERTIAKHWDRYRR